MHEAHKGEINDKMPDYCKMATLSLKLQAGH